MTVNFNAPLPSSRKTGARLANFLGLSQYIKDVSKKYAGMGSIARIITIKNISAECLTRICVSRMRGLEKEYLRQIQPTMN